MALNTWLLYVATVFFVSATPGPNMLLAMTHGIHYGVRRTMATCFGLMSGLGLIMAVSSAGLGALLIASEQLFSLMKWAGAGYLIYLGIKTWRSEPTPVEEMRQTGQVAASDVSPSRLFRSGFLVALSNPKAFVFFTALFPQFMDARQPQAPQLMVLVLTFVVIESAWQFAYASGGSRLANWLNTAQRLRLVNRLSGGAFIAAGVLLSGVKRN